MHSERHPSHSGIIDMHTILFRIAYVREHIQGSSPTCNHICNNCRVGVYFDTTESSLLKTLLSKLFHPEKMGVVQGLSSGIARITMISGPLLSGYIHKDRMVYGGVTSVFVFMNIIGFFIGLKRIHKREKWLRRELRLVEKHGKR